jgi:hypothetical protein
MLGCCERRLPCLHVGGSAARLLKEENVKATMVGVFGIGRSDDLLRPKLKTLALVVIVVQESMTVGQAVEVTRKLCSVLARHDGFAERTHTPGFQLTCAADSTSSTPRASKCRKAKWHACLEHRRWSVLEGRMVFLT